MYVHLLWLRTITPASQLPSLEIPSLSYSSSRYPRVPFAASVPPAPSAVEPWPSVGCLPPSGGTGVPVGPLHASREPSPVLAVATLFASASCYPWQSRRLAAFD